MPADLDMEQLYDDHAQALYAFLLNLTRNEADTHDLLQEIFIKIAREPRLLDGIREERAFLIRLAHNAAIDSIRRRGTRDKPAVILLPHLASLKAATLVLKLRASAELQAGQPAAGSPMVNIRPRSISSRRNS